MSEKNGLAEHEHVEDAARAVLEEAYTTGHHPDPKHPLNLPTWRKWATLVALAWSGFLANYSASCQLTALPQIAGSLGATVPMVANTIGFGLLGLAVGPLFFNPLSMTVGRRPTLILSTLLFAPCAGWLAAATSFNSFAAARVFAGVASAASQTVPPMVIADMFKKSERGDKMAFFGLAVVIAPGLSPLVSAYTLVHKDWPWIYYIVLMFIGLQLLLFVLFVPETQYIPDPAVPTSGRLGVRYWPWQRPREYLALAMRPVLISHFVALTGPANLYGLCFGAAVGCTIVMPRLLEQVYGFGNTAVGLAYLATAIGSVLGKTAGGWVGDRTVLWRQARTGERHPEYRLWAMIPLLPILFVGFLLFGLALQNQIQWIVVLVGVAMIYLGLTGLTGLLQTYMLESYLVEPMNAMAIFQFWKCIWGFIFPFFVFQWGASTSWSAEYIAQAFIIGGLGVLLCGGLIRYGERIRRAQGMPSTDNM